MISVATSVGTSGKVAHKSGKVSEKVDQSYWLFTSILNSYVVPNVRPVAVYEVVDTGTVSSTVNDSP